MESPRRADAVSMPEPAASAESLVSIKRSIWRSAQYAGLITPVYCWQQQADDFVLVDYNDAANDLTLGYISAQIGQLASRIFADSPRPLADLRRCAAERATVVRRGLLRHPGLKLSMPGLGYYLFTPPDLVIVQVNARPAASGGAYARA